MINVPEQFRQRGYKPGYNSWHFNSLPKNCYMMDLDCIEIRNNRPVAIIELRTTLTPLNDWQKAIVLGIANELNLPAYLVSYPEDLSTFKITNLKDDTFVIKNEADYKEWLINLK